MDYPLKPESYSYSVITVLTRVTLITYTSFLRDSEGGTYVRSRYTYSRPSLFMKGGGTPS